MGKFFAALIMLGAFVTLAPVCARLPKNLAEVSVSRTAVEISTAALVAEAAAPVAATPAPAPVAAPVATPKPAPKPEPKPEAKPAPAAELPPVAVVTYRARKMFPLEDGKYLVSIIRDNKADAKAVGARLTLLSRVKGADSERVESGPGQSLAAGTTSYFGLNVSAPVFDALLDAPADEAGSELVWTLTYRYEGEPATLKRCFTHRALPRRRDPEGIAWKVLGNSAKCDDAASPPKK